MSVAPPKSTLKVRPLRLQCAALGAAACCLAAWSPLQAGADDIRFGRDILPILAENCFACHGPDEEDRHAGLRLDTLEGATELILGHAAIVPGDPAASTLIQRIASTDSDDVMPPPKSHKPPLDPDQVELLSRWIKAGAPWGRHWSLEAPEKVPAPEIEPATSHPVDAWVNHRLQREGLAVNGPAAPHSRVRRLAFALTGLPPEPDDISRFTNEPTAEVWQQLVRKYLASPHYGERMAMWWLDVARYSDTDGFQQDAERTNWPWRDYVIDAFNSNMPFDRFTLEQFAGDLLPDPSPEQIIATAFHRNHMTNGEGGRDPEESRVDYVIDRVNTIGSAWLGTTLACAHCHTHKYDPVSHAEYFSLAAFFNSIDEDGRAGGGAKPYHSYSSAHVAPASQEADGLVKELQPPVAAARRAAEEPFVTWLQAQIDQVGEGHQAWHRFGDRVWSAEGTELVPDPEIDGFRARGPNPPNDDYHIAGRPAPALERVSGFRLQILPVAAEDRPDDAAENHGGLTRGKDGWFVLTNVKAIVQTQGSSTEREISITGAVADSESKGANQRSYGLVKDTLNDDTRNGWTTRDAAPGEARVAQFAFAEPWTPADNEELIIELHQRALDGDANIARFRIELMAEPGKAPLTLGPSPLERLAASAHTGPDQVKDELRRDLFEQFLVDYQPFQIVRHRLSRAQAQLDEVRKSAKVNVMVLAERAEPRKTHILIRGEWDQKGDLVQPGIVEAIAPWPEGEPRNRIGLARWITSPGNPLTARVIVNHLWAQLFGSGIVRTADDFGLLGEHPSHPELLDHLALEFIASGWDVKALLELMLTSEAWQRDSAVAPELLEADPHNRLLARGPRYRLPSWMLRDAALHYAGLINPALGGPPVRPWQPPGVWEEMFMGRLTYQPSIGPSQYRRTLYAFWRRSAAPTFLFDSAQRRVCEVSVPRSNTPLHALVLMNDENYLESARALADLALTESPNGGDARLQLVFERVTGRAPEPRELSILQREFQRALDHWQDHPEQAADFTLIGQRPAAADPAVTAATMLVVSMIMNLDEVIHHE